MRLELVPFRTTAQPRHIVLKTVCVMYDRQREGGDFEAVSS